MEGRVEGRWMVAKGKEREAAHVCVRDNAREDLVKERMLIAIVK